MEFRALNNYAQATGQGIQEKIDLAMPSAILKMRFSHYLGEFATDEPFLQATYQAGLQVERLKALENYWEASKPGKAEEKKKEGQSAGKGSGKGRDVPRVTEKETERTGMSGSGRIPTPKSQKVKGTQWSHLGPALKGIDQKEIDTHKKGNDNGCWRCGDHNH
jgi:hypothetical protein